MSTQQHPKAFFAQYAGARNEDDIYNSQWVDTGLTGGKEMLPSGVRGFNVSKQIRHKARQQGVGGTTTVEEGDDYDAVRLGNPAEGWAKFIEQEYGHRNALAILSMWNGSLKNLTREFSEGVEKAEKGAGTKAKMRNAETAIAKVATKLEAKMEEKAINSGVVQDATPILIDPDFLNTVRTAAPILNWVDVVAQAGFTASYNVISGREEPAFGWTTESAVRDMSSSSGSAFTMPNEDKGMKIWADLIDVSDFASRAQSSLDFMDLEGTSMQVRMQEWATEEAEMLLYGEPTTSVTNGGPKDENAPEGLADLAADANASHVTDKSGEDLSGDKALFRDIKGELLSLVNDSAAQIGNLGIAVSLDMFHALENEANLNVRLNSFDQGINFGRDPMGPTTLSIANVPILPDPNIRAHGYSNGDYSGNIGDVFIFDRSNYQRRALQALSSTPLGDLGLASRTALFQYETPVSRSQGEFIRVLEDYSIDALGA